MNKVTFDYSRLRGKIVEKCGSVERFAKQLGITPTTISRKLSGKSEWSQDEIIKACDVLGIPTTQLTFYFFCSNS